MFWGRKYTSNKWALAGNFKNFYSSRDNNLALKQTIVFALRQIILVIKRDFIFINWVITRKKISHMDLLVKRKTKMCSGDTFLVGVN